MYFRAKKYLQELKFDSNPPTQPHIFTQPLPAFAVITPPKQHELPRRPSPTTSTSDVSSTTAATQSIPAMVMNAGSHRREKGSIGAGASVAGTSDISRNQPVPSTVRLLWPQMCDTATTNA